MSDTELFSRVIERVEDWVENALNPQAVANALAILLADHEPAHRHAGAVPRLGLGPGKCTYCGRFGEPLRVFQDEFPGELGLIEMHCHGYYDWCGQCQTTDAEGDLTYPCPPMRAVADALGVQ